MIQLNLLPDLKKEFINAQKNKGVVISVSILVTIGAIGLSVLLFVYVTFVQQLQISAISQDITKKSQELEAVPDVSKYLSIQNQLASLGALHDSKGVYSRLFPFFNVLNPSPPNNINLNSSQVLAVDRTVVFNGSTASFESLNIFVDTLKNAQVTYKVGGAGEPVTESMFEQVFVQSSGLGRLNNKTVVAFTVRAVYRESAFDARNTEVTAKIPNITTTSSSTQAPVPQELFKGEVTQ